MVKKKNTNRRHKIENKTNVSKQSTEIKLEKLKNCNDLINKSDFVQDSVKGLQNNGNTCYFNAMLQILLNCPKFIDQLEKYCEEVQILHYNYMGVNYAFQLSTKDVSDVEKALITLYKTTGKSSSAMPLRSALMKYSSFSSYFGNWAQHDSHEVFINVMNIIKEAQIRRIRGGILDFFNGRSTTKNISADQRQLMKTISNHLENQTFIQHYFGVCLGAFYTCKNCDEPRVVISDHFYISPYFCKIKDIKHNEATNTKIDSDDDGNDDDTSVIISNQDTNDAKVSKHQLKKMKRMAKKDRRRKKKNSQMQQDTDDKESDDEQNETKEKNQDKTIKETAIEDSYTNGGALENNTSAVDSPTQTDMDNLTKGINAVLMVEPENTQNEESKEDLCAKYNIENESVPKDSGKGTSEDTASNSNKQEVNEDDDDDDDDYHSVEDDDGSKSTDSDNGNDIKLTKDVLDEAKDSLFSFACSRGIVKEYNGSKSDLELALELFSIPNHFDGLACDSNRCAGGKKERKSVSAPHSHQDLIFRAPLVLPIFVNRTKNNKNKRFSATISKDQNFYSFPTSLDLTEQCSKLVVSTGKGCSKSVHYKLYGLIKHIGNQRNSGHYVSYINTSSINTTPVDNKFPIDIRRHISNSAKKLLSEEFSENEETGDRPEDLHNDQWVLLDDSSISKVPLSTVLKQQAYMIFYYRCL